MHTYVYTYMATLCALFTTSVYIQLPLGAEWQTAVAYNKNYSLSLSLTPHSPHHNVQEPTGLGGLHPISAELQPTSCTDQ